MLNRQIGRVNGKIGGRYAPLVDDFACGRLACGWLALRWFAFGWGWLTCDWFALCRFRWRCFFRSSRERSGRDIFKRQNWECDRAENKKTSCRHRKKFRSLHSFTPPFFTESNALALIASCGRSSARSFEARNSTRHEVEKTDQANKNIIKRRSPSPLFIPPVPPRSVRCPLLLRPAPDLLVPANPFPTAPAPKKTDTRRR